ncbi:hypothetical protein ACLOJK_041087 [Asimina triloba]
MTKPQRKRGDRSPYPISVEINNEEEGTMALQRKTTSLKKMRPLRQKSTAEGETTTLRQKSTEKEEGRERQESWEGDDTERGRGAGKHKREGRRRREIELELGSREPEEQGKEEMAGQRCD